MRKFILSAFCLATSFNIYAVDCDAAFKDTSYTGQGDLTLVMQLAAASEKCTNENGGNATDQAINCATNAFTALANSGNYVAAEHLAKNYCYDGKINESKSMLNNILNNPNAPTYIKERCTSAMNLLSQ